MNSITVEELKQMKQNGEKVLVDFYATWCGPCKMLLPRLELMQHEYPNVKFVKIDVDQNMDGSMEYGIRGVPTVMIFDGENELFRTSGAKPDAEYKQVLNTI
jgi:thioredoxin 1